MDKFLIVGLGNIGPEYAETRHNIGFKIVDHLVSTIENTSFKTERYADKAEVKIKGRQVFLIKPNTYMNLSGKAVKYWLTQLKIPVENSLVILDDLSLDFGKIRIKKSGSDGGHNGLKSIQEELGHNVYPRLRFGIGNQFNRGMQVDYVLGEWNAEEKIILEERLIVCANLLKEFPLIGIDNVMNKYNNK